MDNKFLNNNDINTVVKNRSRGDICQVGMNINILDSVPMLKNHPYLTLLALCLTLNFAFVQEKNLIVSRWFSAFIFCFLTVIAFRYLTSSVKDFVLSSRGVVFLSPIFVLSFALGAAFSSGQNGVFAGSVVAFVCLLALFLILKFSGRLTTQNKILLIFLVGFAVRLIYCLYTHVADASVRQHDVFLFITKPGDTLMKSFDNGRHAEYIEYIARYLRLPSVDPQNGLSQIYQPPFHHILSALWLNFNRALGMSYKASVEGIQFLTFFYSSSCMITGYKIFKELGMAGKSLLRATAFFSLFPWFFLFSGGVNNDILSVALGLGAILCTIKWYKNPDIINLVSLAFTFGLGMFTKMSIAFLTPAILFVFLVKLIEIFKKKNNLIFTKKGEKKATVLYILCSFALLAAVTLPLGIGWQVRNNILWDTPITYVPSLSETSNQYIGGYALLERLFGMSEESLFSPFIIWGDKVESGLYEYNIFSGLLKTSLFGETTFFDLPKSEAIDIAIASIIGKAICTVLYIFSLIMVVVFCISAFRFVRKKCCEMNKVLVFMLAIVFCSFLANYVISCLLNPFTCSMNFRNAVFCLVPATVILFCEKKSNKESLFEKIHDLFLRVSVFGFSISSVLVYFVLSFIPA